MATEKFTVVALPYSRSEGAKFHVSLFVSPELKPDGGGGELRDFEHFLHWAAVLSNNAKFELSDQSGPIPSKPLLDQLSPGVWDALFPPDTPVRGRRTPEELLDRRWRTFRAGELHDAGKLMHVIAMVTDPTTPPSPHDHVLAKEMRSLLSRLAVEYKQRDFSDYDESKVTRVLDNFIGETGPEPMPLDQLEDAIDSEDNAWVRLAYQVHRARRFYERPEAAVAYQEHPTEGATARPVRKLGPDFHERCSLVGDLPGVQRRLGLVLDVVVKDPSRLGSSQWLSARIVPAGDASACQTTQTRCASVGDDLVTVPSTGDWYQGQLCLGDTDRFSVLDMDPDGTALKLDRYLWSFPRLMVAKWNNDPVHAAPAALRSIGFAVARTRRALETQALMRRQIGHKASVGGGGVPKLSTEDVTQGMRVEVWDDTSGAWYSLHDRLVTADIVDHEPFPELQDVREEGFIEGATLTETPDVDESPVHEHESMFGWDGWSLSAPRPGKLIRHEGGREIVDDPTPDPDPATPLTVTTKVQPHSLPRLRYGRSYAFRSWAVDLAGNSRSHSTGPAPSPSAPTISALKEILAVRPAAVEPASQLAGALRADAAAAAVKRIAAGVSRSAPADRVAEDFTLLSDRLLDRAVLGRLRARRAVTGLGSGPGALATVGRASLVRRGFDEVIVDDAQPFMESTAALEARSLARMVALADGPTIVVPEIVDTVTPLRPFLRWNPVEPPAVVSRHALSAGESLRQVVIRSGVTQDLETLDVAVIPPADYAAGSDPELRYRATSERHVAPPKTSQSEAELHGAFDEAIGFDDVHRHTELLAVALRESGTFFDMTVPRLDDPSQSHTQDGIDLAVGPGVPHADPAELPLGPDEMPAPGQYVIHDTEQLRLPYLPDVLARGISLVFPEAGLDRQIDFPFGTEGFTARYRGTWPEIEPFRLVLEGSDRLQGALDGSVLRVGLPPGDVQRFRLASSFDRADLDLFGLWRVLPSSIRENEDIAGAAADGWLWAFTPYDDVALVHAVPRPLEAPRPAALSAHRSGEGATDVTIKGGVDVHGPSTESLTLEARWVDPVDDLSMPGPEDQVQRAIAFTTSIRPAEDIAVLEGAPQDFEYDVPGAGPVWVHRAIQQLGNTRHHTMRYRFRAATRFREYFDTGTAAPVPGPTEVGEVPIDDGRSVVGPEVEVSVPSSARPAPPVVHSVLPLFRWDEETEPEQPVAVRRRRRAGVRIYLERPWFSSGEGELLGVLVAPLGYDSGLECPVSQWGADPIWMSAPVDKRGMCLEFVDLLRAAGYDPRPGDALPVLPPAQLPLATEPGQPSVWAFGYRPQYSEERQMWYADVAIDPGSTFWPFVRLAVARYQPDSIDGCHLSAPVRCDFVQLTPERTTSVSRTDVRHVRVVTSGPVGLRCEPSGSLASAWPRLKSTSDLADWVAANRRVYARLQRLDPDVPTDLGWRTERTVEMVVRGQGRNQFEVAWVGELEAPEDIPLQRPGEGPQWRVTVEEWEWLPGDPFDLGASEGLLALRQWESRLIYAEEILL